MARELQPVDFVMKDLASHSRNLTWKLKFHELLTVYRWFSH